MKISTTLLAALCSGAQLFAQSGFAPAYQLVTPSSEFQNAVAADLDGDGDIDVISANSSLSSIKGMYSYRNDGAGNFTTAVIGTGQSGWANCIADLDGDGKPDLLSIDATHLWWYRNLGNMQFSASILLSNNITDGRAVTAADSDGDGDLDIFFGEGSADRFGMFINTGSGIFGVKTIINTTSTDVDDIVASDLDGDGDLDLVVSCLNVQDVAWFENLGNNTFGPQHVLTTSTIGNTAVIAADLDGDGDNDIVTSAFGSDDVTWFKNLGNGNFSAPI
ncbi:MAG: VCBS repeat-containing protein, partial [Flavobacteriales bacterium]